MDVTANFIRFPTVQTFWQSVKIWQSYREFKGGNFFETIVVIIDSSSSGSGSGSSSVNSSRFI